MNDNNKVEVGLFIDFAGQKVRRGDYIVYGRIHLQSGELNAAKVVNIKKSVDWNNKDSWSITVIALDDDYKDGRSFKTVMSKKITLQFPNRIVKFDNLPENYKNLLDSV